MLRISFRSKRLNIITCVTATIVILILLNYNIPMHFVQDFKTHLAYHPRNEKGDIMVIDIVNLKTLKSSKPLRVNNVKAITNVSIEGTMPIPFISWSKRSLLSNSANPRYNLFTPLISSAEYNELIEMFKVFVNVCDWFNLTYMLYGGSLLGSYRHHAIVPWDDDIDVLMNASEKTSVLKYFTTIQDFKLCTPRNRQWKFYKEDSNSSQSHYNCSENMWPYIDIFFFSENETHIWDDNEMYKYVYSYKKTDIFPLAVGIFEGSLASVPRNTLNVLQRSYNVDLCVNSLYSHKKELVREGKLVSLPCKRILSYFPFVFRICEEGMLKEYLVYKNQLLYTLSTEYECAPEKL